MARKFARIGPVVLTPDIGRGEDYDRLLQQIGEVLNNKIGEINDVLQRATGTLTDFPLWGRFEIVEVPGNQAIDRGTDIVVRHGLGSIPRWWFPVRRYWSGATTEKEALSQELIESPTPWTDTKVFFRMEPLSAVGAQVHYFVLLIP